MTDAYILEAVRTPVGKNKGSLSSVRSDQLAAETLKALVERTGIDPKEIEDVIMGCVTQVGEQGFNIARNAVLAADLPITVPGTSVNRLCGSSQQAFGFASQAIRAGDMDLVVAAGTESMSRVKMGSDMGPWNENILRRFDIVNQGVSAELVAEKWDIERKQLDEFSLASHQKALQAQEKGHFDKEIVPIQVNGDKVTKDEGPRAGSTLEKLSTLKTVFVPEEKGGKITAASSSQISDGAAALLLGTKEKAEALGLKPRARVVAHAVAGTDPTLMLTGPMPSTKKVLAKAGMKLEDIEVFEVNEAFASVVLAFIKDLAVDPAKVNVNGGAIALGHPLGCTGAKLMTTLLYQMERQGAKYGLVTMCIGGGQGTATIIERCD